jgi:hypothetical protein
MPNQDPPAAPRPTSPARRPGTELVPSRAARHGTALVPAGGAGQGGDPSGPRRRRTAAVAIALVTLVGGLTGGVLALDRRPAGDAGETASTAPRSGQLAEAARPRRERLATSTTRPTAPRRAMALAKERAETTTTRPATSAAGGTSSRDDTTAPPADGFPGAGNTGVPAGVTLTASGPLTVTRDGTVVDRRDIKGCLKIEASNVTVRRSRIRCTGDLPVRIGDGARDVVLEDVEIDGMGSSATTAIGYDNYTLRRADVHDVGDGPRMADNTVVEDSWIHDLVIGGGSHNDGIQSTGGTHIRILHNRIEHPHEQTSCILIGADLGPIHDVLIQGNLLNGGNYTVYAGGDEGYSDIRIVGNRFGRDMVYGTHSLQANIVFSGNVWHDTGKPVNK